jgi:hypothetical protein
MLRLTGSLWLHSADQDGDNRISLTEILRCIQIFRVGRYSCATSSEDGFKAEPGNQSCPPHAADYIPEPDFKLGLPEILRLIQFYNSGAYAYCPDQIPFEDGFCPSL